MIRVGVSGQDRFLRPELDADVRTMVPGSIGNDDGAFIRDRDFRRGDVRI